MSSHRREIERCVTRLVRVFGSDDRIESAVSTLRLRNGCTAMEFGGGGADGSHGGTRSSSRRGHRDGNASAAQHSIVATHYPLSLPSNFVAKPFPFAVVRVAQDSISVYRASDRAFLCDVKWKHVTTLRRHVSDDGAPHVLVVSLAVVHRDGILVLDLPNADVELGIVAAMYAILCNPSESSSSQRHKSREDDARRQSAAAVASGKVKKTKSPSPNTVGYRGVEHERGEKKPTRHQRDRNDHYNDNYENDSDSENGTDREAGGERYDSHLHRREGRTRRESRHRHGGGRRYEENEKHGRSLRTRSKVAHATSRSSSSSSRSDSGSGEYDGGRGDAATNEYRGSVIATSSAGANIVRGSSAGPLRNTAAAALPIPYVRAPMYEQPLLPVSGDALLHPHGRIGSGTSGATSKMRSGSELERAIREREAEMRREIAFNPVAAVTSRNSSLTRLRRSDGVGAVEGSGAVGGALREDVRGMRLGNSNNNKNITSTTGSSGSPYSRRMASSADKEVTIGTVDVAGEEYDVEDPTDSGTYRYGVASANMTTVSTLPPSQVIETTFSAPSRSAAYQPTSTTGAAPPIPAASHSGGMSYCEEDEDRAWMQDRRMDLSESAGLQRRGRRQAASVREEPTALYRTSSPSQQSSAAWKELSPLPAHIASSSSNLSGGVGFGAALGHTPNSRSNSVGAPQSRSDITAEMQSLLRQLENEEAAANKAFNEQQERLKAVARDKAMQLASMRNSSSARHSDSRTSVNGLKTTYVEKVSASPSPAPAPALATAPNEPSIPVAVEREAEQVERKQPVAPVTQKSMPPPPTQPAGISAPPAVPPQPSAKPKEPLVPPPAVSAPPQPSKVADVKPAGPTTVTASATSKTSETSEDSASHPKTESKRVTVATAAPEAAAPGKASEGKEAADTAASVWQARTDKKSGKTYYFNPTTRETRWKLPQEEAVKPQPQSTTTAATTNAAESNAAETKKTEKQSEANSKKEEEKQSEEAKQNVVAATKGEVAVPKAAPAAASTPAKQPASAPASVPPAPQIPPAPMPVKKSIPPPPLPAKKAPPPPIQHPEAMAGNKTDAPQPLAAAPTAATAAQEDKNSSKPAAAADPSAEEEEKNKAENAARRQQAEQKALEDHKQLRVGGLSLAEALARERERAAADKSGDAAETTKKVEPAKAAESSSTAKNEKSAEAEEKSKTGGSETDGTGTAAGTAAKQTVGGSIFGSWKELFHKASGRHYYRHIQTNEAVWKVPDEVKQIKEQMAAKAAKLESSSAGTGTGTGAGGGGGTAPTTAAAKSAAPTAAASKGDAGGGPLRVLGPWKELKDPKSGRIYYANSETKQRTWKIAETPFANA